MDDVSPAPDPLESFLAAVRAQHAEEARALFARHPESAGRELCVDCVLGDEAGVEARLAADPASASRPRGPGDWPPLLYVSASPFHDGSPEAHARMKDRLAARNVTAD